MTGHRTADVAAGEVRDHVHQPAGPAIDRRLPAGDHGVAREIWRCASALRAELSALCAAAVLHLTTDVDIVSYRVVQTRAADRLRILAARVERLELSRCDTARRDLGVALGDLVRAAERHSSHTPDHADSLWRHVIDTYALSRQVGSQLWAFDLRPEGRPLLASAYARYHPVPLPHRLHSTERNHGS